MPGDTDIGFDMDSAVASIAEGLQLGGPDDTDGNAGNADDLALDKAVDEAAAAPAPAAAPVAAPAAGSPPAGTPVTSPAPSPDSPPKTWTKEEAAEWAAMTPGQKAAVLRREEDMFKGIETYKADATEGKAFKDVFQPYESILQQAGINKVELVRNFAQAHHTLSLGRPEEKEAMFIHLAKSYGIDLAQIGGKIAEAPFIDPAVKDLQSHLQRVESQTLELANARRQEALQAKQAEVNAFFDDPKNEYAKDVVDDIAALVRADPKLTLAQAYEKAIWMNPTVRQKQLDAQTQRKIEETRLANLEKANAAKKAAGANVTTRSKTGSPTAPLGSMEDTMKATLAEIQSRT